MATKERVAEIAMGVQDMASCNNAFSCEVTDKYIRAWPLRAVAYVEGMLVGYCIAKDIKDVDIGRSTDGYIYIYIL